ncbi:PREDICTED: early nodulin-like protein 2 [Nelumbo nucifera]|uniref:Early nodulin-like protein 2 n=1 Tax=Nelumbo nucifera TaxID=4432 RepID=A0A1U8AWL0_NELNU|nr:PREDICTED: early nodulin-like protein 2 [Nelumbo nucifera]
MEPWRFLRFLFLMVAVCNLCLSQAHDFYVGGRFGWVLNPSEKYNDWAERNRFQVNDTLVFRYKKGEDSVLVTSPEHYYSCNTSEPIMTMVDGFSKFKFDRSGPFYFISGNPGSCAKGQRLIVVVLAVRSNTNSTPPPPPPQISPSIPSPPPTASPPKAPSPVSPAPSSKTPVPSPSPANSPVSPSPSSSPPVSPTPPSSSTTFTPSLVWVWVVSLVVNVVLASFNGSL